MLELYSMQLHQQSRRLVIIIILTITTNIAEGKPLAADEARARAVAVVGAGDESIGGTFIVTVSLMNAVGADDCATDGLTDALFSASTVGRRLNVALTVGIVGARLVLLVFVLEGNSESEERGACDAVVADDVGEYVIGITVEGNAVFVTSIKLGISDGGSSTVSAGYSTGGSVCRCFSGDLEVWDDGKGPSGGVG